MKIVISPPFPHSARCSNIFSQFSNADNKKFEFDIIGSHQHNPLTFVSCSPPFDAEKRQVFPARRGADSAAT